ncbi:YwqG family protein [Corynebacterium durum]|uniref:YwqG family protein n=1 Tax=Corynebacterium durum TaxID=61592 RepID=UPI0028E6DC06|nr:YwqG family protein [Corynebacterium durum]
MGKILDQVRTVMSLLNERDQSQVIRITTTVSPEPLPVTSSKFGGVPYLPEGVDVPTNAHGDPLGMIAQINCAELPNNDIYPQNGIVQFWMNLADGLWGMDFENPIAQDNTRVTYYPELGIPNANAALPRVDWDDVGWPICPEDVELALSFEVIQQGDVILSEDFFDAFVEQWNSLYPDQTIEEMDELDDLSDELVTDFLDDFTEFHKIGGKPIFVQNDPREFEDNLKNYTVDLLTIVSGDVHDPRESGNSRNIEIMWGDMGTANWLITPEQLAACDFSQVLFEWSCG